MADDIHTAPAARAAAEEAPHARRRFSRAEFDRLVEAGFFLERERAELIGGEVYSMMGEGARHVDAVDLLSDAIQRALPREFVLRQRTRLDLGEDEVYPDILVEKLGTRLGQRNAESVMLIVEAADTSLKFDREVKAARYAAAGFAEYWVFDVNARRLWIHRDPKDGEWRLILQIEKDQSMAPLFAPNASVALPKID
jgi:Uma2 family endonuclease